MIFPSPFLYHLRKNKLWFMMFNFHSVINDTESDLQLCKMDVWK